MTTLDNDPGVSHSRGPKVQEILKTDTRPVPKALTEFASPYVGSEDVKKARYTSQAFADLEKEFDGKGYGDFKASVAEVVVEYLRPIRQRALDLLSDEKHLIDILHTGSSKARGVAGATLDATYKGLGVVS